MKTFTVDAFTDRPFSGNPAGVCLVESFPNDDRMLDVAQELNLSETAFCRPRHDGAFDIRFFSPQMEISLCGHATLAAARVIMEIETRNDIRFVTADGCSLDTRANGPRIEMDLPAYDVETVIPPLALLDALGLTRVDDCAYNHETRILMLVIHDVEELRRLRPDFVALRAAHDSINGVLVTAANRGGAHDFHSRYFWPWSGTDEDPVTGGTHTFLAPYWARRLGMSQLRSFQSSSRTGEMHVTVGDEVVRITASASIVFEGRLRTDVADGTVMTSTNGRDR